MREVKWSVRDDGNSTWAKHYHGDYVVFVTDQDGDSTVWSVRPRNDESERIAHGDVPGIGGMDEFEVGKQIAIAALDAILKDRERQEADYRARPESYPGWRNGRHPHARRAHPTGGSSG